MTKNKKKQYFVTIEAITRKHLTFTVLADTKSHAEQIVEDAVNSEPDEPEYISNYSDEYGDFECEIVDVNHDDTDYDTESAYAELDHDYEDTEEQPAQESKP